MPQVRVGFIGVGGIAELHLSTFQQIEAATITAIYDINEARSHEVAERFGASSYPSVDALLDSGEVDALVVCSPPFARGNIEEEAARRGIHLLAEKPVSLLMEEARNKVAAIASAGIINSSGYCLRYLDTVQHAKTYLAGKKIGFVKAYRLGGLHDVAWWRQMDKSGGQLVEQSTHQVDLIRYVAGEEFTSVNATYAQRHILDLHPEATINDVGTVNFTLQSGAVGNMISSCIAAIKPNCDVEIYGIDFYVGLLNNGFELRIIDAGQDTTTHSSIDCYLEQNKAFIAAIQAGDQSLVQGSYAEAVATLAMTLAANQSAEQGQQVNLA